MGCVCFDTKWEMRNVNWQELNNLYCLTQTPLEPLPHTWHTRMNDLNLRKPMWKKLYT